MFVKYGLRLRCRRAMRLFPCSAQHINHDPEEAADFGDFARRILKDHLRIPPPSCLKKSSHPSHLTKRWSEPPPVVYPHFR